MESLGNGANDPGQARQGSEGSQAGASYPGGGSAQGGGSAEGAGSDRGAGAGLAQVTDQAKVAATRAREALADSAQQLRERASQASESAVAYTKDEPMKALLIAGAAGAILMGILNMLVRSRD
jgi:ElaB/YqjD/DUF883 family membrane-anchored ribosome-binding protein